MVENVPPAISSGNHTPPNAEKRNIPISENKVTCSSPLEITLINNPMLAVHSESAIIKDLREQIAQVAPSNGWVLVTGENGTGKELIARAVHRESKRASQPFVEVNCAAIPEELIESELFGHEKGSFTGAHGMKRGKFEQAAGGTLFLDEIGDMSLKTQAKILRVLQERKFTRVGGAETIEVDVRIVAATNKELPAEIAANRFREDLYYRINVIRIQVPPLRDRKDDLPILIDHFFRKHHRDGQRARGLAPDAVAILTGYHWPGNIRELENEIERLLVLGSDLEVIPGDLISSRIKDAVAPANGAALSASRTPLALAGKLNDAVESLEREMISQGLTRTRYNKSKLSRELGISRSNLILKIAKYALDRPGLDDDKDEPELPVT